MKRRYHVAKVRLKTCILLRVPWLPRRALPYIAFVALIADLLSRACDGCVVGEQAVRDSIVAERALATTPCGAVHCFCRFDC